MAKVSLELLTDEDIIDYTKSDNRDRVLTDHRDLNLRCKVSVQPIPGGTYDAEIFGSPYEDRCICGKIRQISSEPCPHCGARVFSREEGLRRFARIELPFYYLNDLRFDIFMELFNRIFEGVKIKLDFQGDDLKRLGYAGRSSKKLGIKAFDTCQFEYSKAKNELKVSEFITDESKCSYEGLMAIIEKHFPDYLLQYKRLINRYYLVQPARMRPFSLAFDGNKKMHAHKLSIWYSIIIRLCCVEDVKSNPQNYNAVRSQFKTPGERVRYTALLRALINAGKKQATDLLNTSKKNEARGLYSARVKNSARCPIVPDTELKVDEIGVPIHLAYEMCREGFIKYLMSELNFTEDEAKKSTKEEYNNPELMRLFKEYAEQQVVLVNRQPTLYEYGIYACHVRLVDQNAIGYPIELCGPLNADFDGDTVSLILVPEEAKEDTLEKMSPRINKIYKKNLKNIFEFNHETLNGLANLSEVIPEDPSDIDDPKYYYTDYAQLLKDVEVEGKIKATTPIVFSGKVGELEFQSKKTTYGRLRLSKIIKADIDQIKVGGENVIGPTQRFSGKTAAKLMSYLYGYEDWVEKANEIQKLSLKYVTRTGVVGFSHDTLYADTDTKTYKKIRQIADSKELTDKQKLLLISENYNTYLKEIESEFSSDLKNELDRSGRVKISSIVAINSPQFIISGVDEKPVLNKGSLLGGLTEKEYISHTIENRSLQSIKASGVKLKRSANDKLKILLENRKKININ